MTCGERNERPRSLLLVPAPVSSTDKTPPSPALPPAIADWFAQRGWAPRPHQLALLERARAGHSALLVAPTGAGKTLAGFLPTLVDLHARPRSKPGEPHRGIHTLYLSPLKALAVDVARNLTQPIEEMGLPVRVETRTGDTPTAKRQRQTHRPPDILMTTPEQLALLISNPRAREMFGRLARVVIDELHALVTTKRGDLLALGLARLRRLSPSVTVTGLSATVAHPDALRAWLTPRYTSDGEEGPLADLVTMPPGALPDVTVLASDSRIPWSGHSARYAVDEVMAAIRAHHLAIIFVNTRSQAESIFQALWMANDEGLPIGLHHGSLDVAQRRRVEAAMADGSLRAVVATATLDLGIDWGDVDLVVHVGAPKGASRLAQRIGRANHRLDEPSRAILVPANRFEIMECEAAAEALARGAQDTEKPGPGGLDVLAQHVLGCAVAEPFDADDLYREVVSAAPYEGLTRADFDRVIDFVATGGYALKVYESYAKIRRGEDGLWRITSPLVARQYRMNVGTIVADGMMKVRLAGRRTASGLARGGRVLGEIEEWYVEQLVPGDTFVFGGEVLRFEGLREEEALVTRSKSDTFKVPSYRGSRFPLTTFLSAEVREIVADPARWKALPEQLVEWLEIQARRSIIPGPSDLLVETFPHNKRSYLVAYPFEGRPAHQTLGMLLTRRLDRYGAKPAGYMGNDYALSIWCREDVGAMVEEGVFALDDLFDEDILGDDLEAWMLESSLMKRTFRNCAVVSGLIERRHPGREKSGRQVTVSTDLVYDVLRSHDPGHILLEAARKDAARGLIDVGRIAQMLARVKGHVRHVPLTRVSPLAVPIILEYGREFMQGAGQAQALEDASQELLMEAMAEL